MLLADKAWGQALSKSVNRNERLLVFKGVIEYSGKAVRY